jgi:O-6-methylguanine DNA methyltransferase
VISICVGLERGTWYGVAHHDGRLVATATGRDRDAATRSVRGCLPRGVEYAVSEEEPDYVRDLLRLLARLEAGEEQAPAFELCPDCVSRPLASVAHVASAIPRGFVATYGSIAAAAGTEARVVGHIMATNPLYPLIPCHRVVGADFALVGYTGSQEAPALRAKLERLRAEAGGFTDPRSIPLPQGAAGLVVHPVERVVAAAVRDGLIDGGQLSLW